MSEDLGRAVLTLEADGSKLDRDMQGAHSRAVNVLNDTGDAMKSTGATMTKRVTAPIVGLAGAAIAVGVGFDDQMARVRAASGATGEEFEQLRGTAQELGRTTRFSASEAAEGMEFLAFAGFETGEVIEAMPGLLDLASAGNLELARASDIVSDTMMAFGIEAADAGVAADIFAQQVAQSNTSVDQLGEAMKMAAPQAAAAGMSLEQTSAVLGVLADAGLKGSMAGTTVNAMLRDLIGAAEDGAVAIGETSVEVFDAEGNMRDFGSIMRDVTEATEGMNDEQRENALRSVFQAQSIRGVNLMLGDGIDAFDEYAAANENSAGKAGEMAGVMEDTLGGAFREMKAALEGILIDLSDELVPIMREHVVPAIKTVGEAVSGLIAWFSGLDDRTKTIILAVVGLVAALGPLLFGLGVAVKMIGTAVAAFGPLIKIVGLVAKGVMALIGVLSLKIIIIAAVAAAVVAAAWWLWKNWDKVVELLTAAWEWVKEQAEALRDWVVDAITGMRDRVVALNDDIRDRVLSAIAGLRDGAIRRLQDLVAWVRGLPGRIWSALSGFASRMVSRAKEAMSALQGEVVRRANNVLTFYRNLPGRIVSALGNLGRLLVNAGRQIIQGLWDGLKERWNQAKQWVSGIGSQIANVKGPLDKDRRLLIPAGEAIMGSLREGLGNRWPDVRDFLTDVGPQMTADLTTDIAGDHIGRQLNFPEGLVRIEARDPSEAAREASHQLRRLTLEMS